MSMLQIRWYVCKFAMQSQNPRSQLENSNFDTFWAGWVGWFGLQMVGFANGRFCKCMQRHTIALDPLTPLCKLEPGFLDQL